MRAGEAIRGNTMMGCKPSLQKLRYSVLRQISYYGLISAFALGIGGRLAIAAEIKFAVKLSPAIEEQLALPESKIDVANAALVFAKELGFTYLTPREGKTGH